MARRQPSARGGKKCCVHDGKGKLVACFAGKDAAQRANALRRIVKRTKTVASCELPMRGGR